MSAERPLGHHLESPTDEIRISRMWRVIRARRTAPTRVGWIAVPALVALAVAGWLAWPRSAVVSPARSAPSAVIEAPSWSVPDRFDAPTAQRFELADGSAITLAAGSRLSTIESGDERFVTLLERGTATFEVRPGGPRRWIVEVGLATVEVVGTVFSVERRDAEVEVAVERGIVLVRGERVPDRVARLGAGDRLVVREPTTATVEPIPEVRPPRPRTAAPREDIGELVAQASTAQRTGDFDEAARLLRRAMAHDDPRAAIAAYTLGRLEMDELHRPARARAAFERALTIGLPERMAQQARGRLEQIP